MSRSGLKSSARFWQTINSIFIYIKNLQKQQKMPTASQCQVLGIKSAKEQMLSTDTYVDELEENSQTGSRTDISPWQSGNVRACVRALKLALVRDCS